MLHLLCVGVSDMPCNWYVLSRKSDWIMFKIQKKYMLQNISETKLFLTSEL